MRKKTWTNEQLINAVKSNNSAAGVLKEIGLKPKGGNYKTINLYIKNLQLDTSHWSGQGHLRNKTHNWGKKIPISEILVEDSTYLGTNNLKKRLLKEGLLKYNCLECGINEWKDKPLTLHLDHINGNHSDNRFENLRLLCPNCHSQTETYTGKNIQNSRKFEPNRCKKCQNPTKYYNSKLCLSCFKNRYKS